MPSVLAESGTGKAETVRAAVGEPGDYGPDGRLDLGIRLAAGEIMTGRGYRSIVYITHGNLEDSAFRGYSVLDTARFLKNNGIGFYVIYLSSAEELSRDLEYLCEETGGESLYLYQPMGLTTFYEDITDKANGSYTLEYTSRAEGDFGRRFIPFQMEVLLYNRSGRERSGYFSPAEY